MILIDILISFDVLRLRILFFLHHYDLFDSGVPRIFLDRQTVQDIRGIRTVIDYVYSDVLDNAVLGGIRDCIYHIEI